MSQQHKLHNKITHKAQARYALLNVGLPTERGNTLECRRKFFMGCREAPKSARPVAYATFATLLIQH